MSRLSRKIIRPKRKCKIATDAYAHFLRKNPTKAEAYFWKHLKKEQREWQHQFAQQQIVYGYIPDLYCPTLQLAVEIDGLIHRRKDVRRRDALRTRRLKKQGVTVVRFTNSQVFSNPHALINILEEVCG